MFCIVTSGSQTEVCDCNYCWEEVDELLCEDLLVVLEQVDRTGKSFRIIHGAMLDAFCSTLKSEVLATANKPPV